MQKETSLISVLPFLRVFLLLIMVATIHQAASAQPDTPEHLRVDISDGNTGQLFISWDQMPTAKYYNLWRSTSPTTGYGLVNNCNGPTGDGSDTPFQTQVCRDSGLAVTNPPTVYYYKVAACNSSGLCSQDTLQVYPPAPSNTPVSCNCTQGSVSSQIPPMVSNGKNLTAPNPIRLTTTDVTSDATYMPNAKEFAAYHNANSNYGIPPQNKLVIQLPGSGSTCSYSHFMYTAQNLGFDTICVNYSNNTQQENICKSDPQCFYYITEAKFDASGPCIHWEVSYQHCGYDNATDTQYWNVYADSVLHRVITMLQYLSNPANGYTGGANWGQYLTAGGTAPNWSKIIVGGFSQGGDMATYIAGLENTNGTPILRAINLSAPPQATQVPDQNGPWVAAAYFAGPPPWFTSTTIRNVFGLVSANDSHYTPRLTNGVYQVVWTAMGFTAANNDAEWDLNCTTSMNAACTSQGQPITAMQGLNCLGTPSNNLVNFAQKKFGGSGHDDTLEMWNQDLYEFLLLDN